MADQSTIYCPLCGNKVPQGVTKCPVCATELQQVSARRSVKKPAERLTEDFLHREIPRVVLPETKQSCPLCALELKGKETRCPRCGVPLSVQKEEEMLECPECGSLAPFGSKSCPKCGVGFEEGPGPPPIEEIPPPPEPLIPEPAPPRPTPEIATVIPATPAPATKGFINGTGAVNGTGLVNGTGMINGTKGETRGAVQKRQKLFLARWQFLAVLVAIVIVIPTFIYLSYSQESPPFTVDGVFEEWDHADKFGMYSSSGVGSIDVEEWALEIQDTRLFLYISTNTSMMTSTDVCSVYMFIDSDDSVNTGYEVSGLGADYLLQIDGWNGTAQAASLSEYGSATDKYDWSSWDYLGSLGTAVSGNKLEAVAEMPVVLGDDARFLLISQNNLDQRSTSYSVPAKGGLLVIEQETGADVLPSGLVDTAASVQVLRLRLSCEGTHGTVNSIVPSVSGATIVTAIEDIHVDVGDEQIVEVILDSSTASAGSLISVAVDSADVETTFSDVQIVGETVKVYVLSAPGTIEIDGAFADWNGKITVDSDSATIQNENIDITAVGAVNDTVFSAFYVSVVGEMCSGSFVPAIKEKPAGGGGGVVIPTRKTGEDIVKVYIDSDMNSSSGFAISLASKIIGADYLLEVKGLNGKVVSKSLMRFQLPDQWAYMPGTIDAANDLQRLEMSVSAGSIGGASSIDFIVEMTDWRPKSDFATAVPQSTRAIPGGLPMGASIMSWPVESGVSPTATAMSYQRKLFFDGINLWSFYFDGTNTVYKYSNDSGQTWYLAGQAFSAAGVDEASLWHDYTSNIVYIVGDIASASQTVHVRRGVVDPSNHTITWSSLDSTPTVSSVALGGKNTYISKDRAGYLWLMSSNCTQSSPSTRYDLSVFVSQLPDNETLWRHTGNMLMGSNQSALPNIKGSIVNIGTGSVMLAVYIHEGNVSSRTYTASWDVDPQSIYPIGSANPGNTDLAPPSVVVDSNGIAHVVYGNGHAQAPNSLPWIYYSYFNGSSWWPSRRLDAQKNNEGNFYPTISLDRSTGNVIAFWIATSGKQGLTIQAEKNISGTWTPVTLGGDTTFVKQYLTSIYSAPNEQWICWQWTQNTTPTVELLFDKIPEFSDVAFPVVLMMVLFITVLRRASAKRRDDS